MQNAAGNTKPIAVNGFPLAARPQNVPNPIDDRPIISSWSPWASFLGWFRQMFLDSTPQWAWDAEIVNIFWLLFILLFQDAPRWTFVFGQTYCPQGVSFV